MTEPASSLRIAIATETHSGERRVAVVPRSIPLLTKAGATVCIQSGAGVASTQSDDDYRAAGADIAATAAESVAQAAIILTVRGLQPSDIERLPTGSIVIGLLSPGTNGEMLRALAARNVSAFALEQLPRITRAQDMDVLSSMSTVSGYYAVLMAAIRLPKFFPLLMTAAGTVPPARVLVLGAGVAGLQAVATAKRLGSLVEAFDVRPAVREQVESLGAKFVEVDVTATQTEGGYATSLATTDQERLQNGLAPHVADADVVITTALIPNRPAPQLITRAMVESMRPGSVIIDLAAEQGGNCEVTTPGEDIVVHGITVSGPTDIPSRMAAHASQLFSHNITRFVLNMIKDGKVAVDLNDEILKATCVTHDGTVLFGKAS